MAMNRIQFQHGMSLPEFLRGFGTEATCAQAVMAVRWPNGFECPKCSEEAHCVISVSTVGRGSENKVPFVAAVSLNEMGHPVYPAAHQGGRLHARCHQRVGRSASGARHSGHQ